MNLIVPMAGRGKRLRPHTLSVPKPLLPVAGRPIVVQLVEDLIGLYGSRIERIGFVVGHFGAEAEGQLLDVAQSLGAEGRIYYQEQALGTAHAVECAGDLLEGQTLIAFADTLFRADGRTEHAADGTLWVRQVDDPSRYGVVTVDTEGYIDRMVEKPTDFVSDLALIGIYSLRKGEDLRQQIRYLLDNNIKSKGEFQLTDALARMQAEGARFWPERVDEWLDCGSKDLLIDTNRSRLADRHPQSFLHDAAELRDTILIHPCYVDAAARIERSVIGPYVSVGAGATIEGCNLRNCIVRESARLSGLNLEDSIVGAAAQAARPASVLDLGDFSRI